MQTIKQTIITIIICMAVVAGVSLVSAWTGPPYQRACSDPPCPPGGNVPAPINVGALPQIKSGALQVNGLRNLGATILDGNVGIGTASPSQKLDVNGNINVGGSQVRMSNSSSHFYGDSSNLASRSATGDFYIQNSTGGNGRLITTTMCLSSDCRTSWPAGGGGLTGGGSTNYVSKWTGSTSLGNSIIYDNGNVGIGTTNPGTNKLQVNGKIQAIGGDICTDQGGGKCLSAAGGAISGGLYGHCKVNYDEDENPAVCSESYSPASCSGNNCVCPSGYTRSRTGREGQDTISYFSCYKN